MSKIAIINDSHWGVKNGSDIFLDYQSRFFLNTFFPYVKENKVSHIIHLGDFFEHRKYINFKVLNRSYRDFIAKLEELGVHMHIVLGNHDVYYKNTNELNSLKEVLDQYDCITVYESPQDIEVEGCKILMLPWVCPETLEETKEAIQSSKAQIAMGHLELAGFDILKGIKSKEHEGGLKNEIFDRFEMVLSGHYHTKSSKGNIHYLGTQYELTWSDADDPKYFHVLDTNTRELDRVRNYETMFHKLIYDDDKQPELLESHKGTYIKVVILNKKNLFEFDRWYDKLMSIQPFEVKIVESFEEYIGENIDDEGISTTDTPTLLNSYIDASETQLNKDILKKLMHELYIEAQELSDI